MKVEFYRHNLSKKDKQEVLQVLNSLFLTTGDWTKTFEEKFAKYLGSKYVVGVTSCTNAMEIALKYFKIKKGDEVITTPMSFVATANVVEYCGAKPVFIDIEKDTGNINADLIGGAITPRTKAVLIVHLYGQMCDMNKIKKIADKYNLRIIEDAAHCIEGIRDGIRVGEFSDMACFSFYATKNITCGEGGAISCNDAKIYNWLLMARQHGTTKNAADRYSKKYEHYDMEFLGYKCNMDNIQAALLINQIDSIEKLLAAKEKIAQQYNKGFEGNPNIKLPKVLPRSKHARHLYTILVNPKKRDEYLRQIQEAGVGVAVNFRPIHLMHYYRKKYGYKKGDFPIAEKIGNSSISIPFYPKLTQGEIKYVIDIVNKITNA